MSNFNLYLDESGNASINDFYDTYFVIAGVMLESQYDHDLTSYFSFLKTRYGLPTQVNFHSSEFFESEKSNSLYSLSDSQAMTFCNSLCEVINTLPIKIIAHAINKELLREILKLPSDKLHIAKKLINEEKDIGYQIIIRKLLFEFTSHLMNSEATGSVIAESRKELDKVMLQAYLETIEPVRFKNKPYYHDISDNARKRISSLRLENKRGLTGGLEIADICSYIIYRHLHGTLENSANRGSAILWETIQSKIEQPLNSKNGILLTKKDISRVASDRVCMVSNRILARIKLENIQTLP